MEDPIEKKRRAPGAGAKPGERRGGRTKGSLNRATVIIKDLAEKMGTDPVQTLLAIVGTNCIQVPIIDATTGQPIKGEDGQPVLEWQAVTTRMRLDAAKELLPYLAPRLASVALTGKDGGPVAVAAMDMTQILMDPDMAKTAQKMALMLAEQKADQNVPQQPHPYDNYQPKE